MTDLMTVQTFPTGGAIVAKNGQLAKSNSIYKVLFYGSLLLNGVLLFLVIDKSISKRISL